MPAWETNSASKKLCSAPESINANRGKDILLIHSLAGIWVQGLVLVGASVLLTSSPTATGEPALLGGEDMQQGNVRLDRSRYTHPLGSVSDVQREWD